MNYRTIGLVSVLGVALALPALHCGHSNSPITPGSLPPSQAAPFAFNTVASGLTQPTGLALAGSGTLVVAQQPPSPQDAAIAKVSLRTGAVTLVPTGSAVLGGFAANREGRLYWVDASTGTLMTLGAQDAAPTVLHAGGMLPATTLAVDTSENLYIAGTASGANGTAAVLVRGAGLAAMADPGGPVKTAMAAGSGGDLYWTSSAAGVIYHLAPDGTGSNVVTGLHAPTGIALDAAENILYFTEVPEPGKDGGQNTVNALDLATQTRTVIHKGDPQPTSVAVAPNGNVYWTSTSRGQVMEAVPAAAVAAATQFSATLTGGAEVPPVTTTATGQATLNLVTSTSSGEDDDHVSTGTALTYRIAITGAVRVRRIEIHQGAVGANGPLVATLSRGGDFGDDDDDDGGGTSFAVTGRIRVRNLVGPFARDWAGFTAALNAGGLYLNVLTQAHPTGELRGQILPPTTTTNQPPTGTITAPTGNVTIAAGQSVTFAGTATDPNGDAVTVLWNFGDGTTSALLSPGAHTYAAAGTFTVRLTATDAKGAVDPNPPTRTITVTGVATNQPPNGTITAPAANVTIGTGQSVTFTGTATDPNGDPVTVLWNFGDGSSSTLLAPPAHTYAAAGTFTVTFTATDSQGAVDPTPATRTITVTAAPVNQAPNATITAPAANVTIAVGQSVSFAGTATDPDVGDTVTVLWTFGDGGTSTSLTPGAHTFATAGTFTVTLLATDNHGLADPTPATRVVTVTAAAAPTLTQIQTTIFTPSCISCHDAGGSAGLNLTAGSAYANLVNVPATTLPGNRVVPGNPGASALVTQLANGHRSVSAANQALISAWISAGALNN